MIYFLVAVLIILLGVLVYSLINSHEMKKIVDKQGKTIEEICKQLDIID